MIFCPKWGLLQHRLLEFFRINCVLMIYWMELYLNVRLHYAFSQQVHRLFVAPCSVPLRHVRWLPIHSGCVSNQRSWQFLHQAEKYWFQQSGHFDLRWKCTPFSGPRRFGRTFEKLKLSMNLVTGHELFSVTAHFKLTIGLSQRPDKDTTLTRMLSRLQDLGPTESN